MLNEWARFTGRVAVLFLTALVVGSQAPAATPAADINHPFAVYIGADGYRFSPLVAGKLGSVRLFGVLEYPDAPKLGDTGTAVWRLDVLQAGSGKLVRTTGGRVPIDGWSQQVVEFLWDGRDQEGQLVEPGTYSFGVRARFLRKGSVQELAKGEYDEASGIEAQAGDEEEVVVDYNLTANDSNRLRALVDPGACQLQQNAPFDPGFPFNFYYGGTHSHSKYSDGGHPLTACSTGVGTGTFSPSDVYTYARNNAGMDFWFITDHNHLFDDAISSSNPPVTEAKVLQRYQDGLAAAAAATQDGAFVGVWGQEFGVISNGGHVIALETPGLFGWESCSSCNGPTPECTPGTNCYFDFYVPKYTYLTFYAQSVAHPSPVGPLGSFAHPNSSDFNNWAFDANADAAIQGLAIRSGLASSAGTSCSDANAGSSNNFSDWTKALNIGFHVAPTGESDAHCNNYGLAVPTRTVYLLPNGSSPVLTKAALLAAHKARHFFASEDPNLQLVFATSDNSHIMGDIFTVGSSVTLRAAVQDPEGESVGQLELWRGQIGAGQLTAPYQTFTNQATFSVTEELSSGTYYYFVHAVQADGHDAWSAPMWITFGGSTCSTAPIISGTPSAADVDACADSGVVVTYPAVADWNDAGGSGSRSIEVLRSTNGTTWTSCGFDSDLASPYTDLGGVNGTAYYYRVKVTNRCGVSAQIDGSTTGTDVVNGPLFAGIGTVTDPDPCAATGVTIQWASPSDWNDGCSVSCSRSFVVYRDSVAISGLLAATATSFADTPPAGSHTYRVVATNHTGCANDGGVTMAGTDRMADGTAPLITVGPAATPAATSITVTWTTDEPADSRVEYGPTASYGSIVSSASFVTAHSLTVNGLAAGSTYHFRVGSADACGAGPRWSADAIATTTAGGGGLPLDVGGFTLTQANASYTYTIPAGTSVPAEGYIVIARSADKAAFEAFWHVTLAPGVVFLNSAGVMPVINGSETYTLSNASATVIDGPTIAMASSGGQSIRRNDPCLPAGTAASWTVSAESGATVGSGAGAGCGVGLVINGFSDASGTGNYVYEFIELHYDAPAAAPTVTTATATTLTPTSASLNGTVNPNGAETTASFEWGTTDAYGQTTAEQEMGAGSAPVAFTAGLTGLAPCTTYHYRATATNSAGTTTGTDLTFSTASQVLDAPSAGNGGAVCAGGTISLTASTVPGATYSWTGPNGYTSSAQNPTIPNATAAMAGTYSVRAAVDGCTSPAGTTDVVVNEIPAAPVIFETAGVNPSCSGSLISLDAGAGYTAYNWSTGETGRWITASPTMTTTYHVSVANGTCWSPLGTFTQTIVEPPTAATVGGPQTICALGTTAALGGNTPTTGTGHWSVMWGGTGNFSPSATTPDAVFTHVSGTGPITLRWTVLSNAPCTPSSADVVVTVNPVPTAPTAGNGGPYTEGATISLTASTVAGAAYSWTGPNGFSSTLQNPTIPNATTAMGGTYSVTVTVAGCTSTPATTTVVVSSVWPLTVTKLGTGTGTITSTPAGISCGTSISCVASFAQGTSVVLAAVPDSGYFFAGWGGEGCSGMGTCTVAMTQARYVTAVFDPDPTVPQLLSVTVEGSGIVTSVPAGITCPGGCSKTFTGMSNITLLAAPGPGYRFAGWSGGACAGTGPCALTMDSAKTVIAVFLPATPSRFYTITPCRIVDTRNATGPLGGPALAATATRSFALADSCGVPADATALSMNVTVTNPTAPGHLTVYPGSGPAPEISVINFVPGKTLANNVTMGLIDGRLSVVNHQAAGTVELIIDVSGFYR